MKRGRGGSARQTGGGKKRGRRVEEEGERPPERKQDEDEDEEEEEEQDVSDSDSDSESGSGSGSDGEEGSAREVMSFSFALQDVHRRRHGEAVRTLMLQQLQSGGALPPLSAGREAEGDREALLEMLLAQVVVGTVVCSEEGDDDDDDDEEEAGKEQEQEQEQEEGDVEDKDVFAVCSVLCLTPAACEACAPLARVKAVLENTVQPTTGAAGAGDSTAAVESMGLLLQTRMSNLALPIVVAAYNCVLDDVEWAAREAEVEEERTRFSALRSYVRFAACETAGETTSTPAELGTLVRRGVWPSELLFDEIEDDTFAQHADFRTLLYEGHGLPELFGTETSPVSMVAVFVLSQAGMRAAIAELQQLAPAGIS